LHRTDHAAPPQVPNTLRSPDKRQTEAAAVAPLCLGRVLIKEMPDAVTKVDADGPRDSDGLEKPRSTAGESCCVPPSPIDASRIPHSLSTQTQVATTSTQAEQRSRAHSHGQQTRTNLVLLYHVSSQTQMHGTFKIPS
jgi:hypothetical protein